MHWSGMKESKVDAEIRLHKIIAHQNKLISDLVDTLKAYAGIAPKSIFSDEGDEQATAPITYGPELAIKKLKEYNII